MPLGRRKDRLRMIDGIEELPRERRWRSGKDRARRRRQHERDKGQHT